MVTEHDLRLSLFSSRDRIRTAVNVLGDSVGAGVVDQLSRKDLQKMDELRAREEEETDLQDAVATEYIAAPF